MANKTNLNRSMKMQEPKSRHGANTSEEVGRVRLTGTAGDGKQRKGVTGRSTAVADGTIIRATQDKRKKA